MAQLEADLNTFCRQAGLTKADLRKQENRKRVLGLINGSKAYPYKFALRKLVRQAATA